LGIISKTDNLKSDRYYIIYMKEEELPQDVIDSIERAVEKTRKYVEEHPEEFALKKPKNP